MRIMTILMLLSSLTGISQTVNIRHMLWGTHFGEYKFNSSLSVNLDAQFRYEYTDGDIFQWLVRPGVTFKTKSGWMFTAGPAFFSLYPNPNGPVPRPEIRPWLEAARRWQLKDKHIVWPRLRLEQRFIREYEG